MGSLFFTTITAFVVAVIGWFLTEFIGRPIRRFIDLRGEVIQHMTQFGNVPARWIERRDEAGQIDELELSERDAARLEQAQQTFRDLASKMRAFALNEILATWFLKKIGYDPMKASTALFGHSNSLDTYGLTRHLKHKAVQDALWFDESKRTTR
jgi:hypothetical protein